MDSLTGEEDYKSDKINEKLINLAAGALKVDQIDAQKANEIFTRLNEYKEKNERKHINQRLIDQ
jgi:hypothetical protein